MRRDRKLDGLLIALGNAAERGDESSIKARSLIDWYYKHGELTRKQIGFAEILIKRKPRKEPKESKEYFLYAISDGVYVKLGFSSSTKARLKELQTASPAKLKILWRYRAGFNRGAAAKAERKLHRYCRQHKKRGEWFELSCMERVKKFTLDRDKQEHRTDEEHELDIVHAAKQFI